VLKAYTEIEESIKQSLENDKIITIKEFKNIKNEILDIQILSNENMRNRKDLLTKLEEINSKMYNTQDCNNLSIEEAKLMLDYTQDLHKYYQKDPRFRTREYKIDTQSEVNQVQKRLIKKIL
jgi:hypothetical protein